MAAPRTPSRTSTLASQGSTTSSTTASRNAALVGASAAFGRTTPKARAPVNTYSGTNGAFAAAFSAGTGSNSPSPRNSVSMATAPQLFPNSTGGSMRSSRNKGGNGMPGTISHLGLPPSSKSPSQQAASLAAARAPPSTQTSPDNGTVKARAQPQRPAVAPKPRRLSEYHKSDLDIDAEKPTDSTSIAPTTSLVDLFERKASTSQKAGKRPEPIVIKPSTDLAIKSPKPVRASSGISSVFKMELEHKPTAPPASASNVEPKASEVIENRPPLAPSISHSSTSSDVVRSSPVASSSKRDPAMTRTLAPEPRRPAKRVPSPSPLRSSTVSQAIDIQKPPPRTATAPLEMFPTSPTSLKSLPAQYNYLHPRRMTPNMTGDQLANAMVAGSLASSRAPSPKKMDPPPLPSRRLKHHHTFSFSRTPSPAKSGMLTTLRKTASETSDDEDEVTLHPYGKHKKNRLVRKHPNKHHEGDRKRWRDAVTERERKRYEGVWAANKGLYCSFSREEEGSFRRHPSQKAQAQEALQDDVSNIVIRDLWSRSRLPESTLEMIWDLVDNENVGRLGKEEFVVGMWLIDQRLKGRKLPTKVTESVWASVRGLQGIKIRK